jgi:hypothetical protein
MQREMYLQPGEKFICRIRRNRNWYSLAANLLVDILLAAAIVLLFRYLERFLVESYIRSGNHLSLTNFIVISLFINVVPILTILALAQDLILTFFLELSLSNQRIIGRVSGMFWLKNIHFSLAEVESIGVLRNHLSIQFSDGRIELISGFQDTRIFSDAFQDLRLGFDSSLDLLFEDLPDAFTFQSVH